MAHRSPGKIGSYKIRWFLGRGTMGRVYKVTLPGLEKTAALKLFAPTKALDRKFSTAWLKERFIHEARVIANIRHPNVAGIWKLETREPDIFYIMEYYNRNLGEMIGESYWAEMTSRIVPIEKTCHYLHQILEGLSRLHHAKIIHQDIKPFNIMLSDEGIVKIVDFGLSKRRGEKPAIQPGSQTARSRFIGTPFYAAPEQIHSRKAIDHRADLYSAGVILYRMLTGHLPTGKTVQLPSRLNPMLDKNCDAFILKAMAQEPENRFQDAETMADALKQLSLAYNASRKKECEISDSSEKKDSGYDAPVKKTALRSQPSRILRKKARKMFRLNRHDQPAAYIQNDFQAETERVIVDRATGLVWQQAGSGYPMSWSEAQRYIKEVSDKGLEGYTGWRLPTMNELLSLLNSPSPENFCLEPVFSDVQKCLWSADSRSGRSAWVLDLEMGFVTSCDVTDYFHVKGVCSL